MTNIAKRQYYIYIASNQRITVLYTGITGNIIRRMFEHKHKLVKGFTSRYNIDKLLYYEVFNSPKEAIAAEKKIKGWTRAKKVALIKSRNPELRDLSEEWTNT